MQLLIKRANFARKCSRLVSSREGGYLNDGIIYTDGGMNMATLILIIWMALQDMVLVVL